ncbi:MAG TPA: PPK2 family polyphosphate kinase [Pyrinomonadaceae bacterium]|jgi:PPK2 family polyphosphate:nucleotide phosphotransferase|nr:PPK2 family polyphosphate kinase [Pyrinomonadaceae bacterium]
MSQRKFRVPAGKRLRLESYDPAFTGGFKSREEAEAKIQRDCESLAQYQDKLLAEERQSLLLIFQAMDGAGKDGTIKHVMSSVDPQGCVVTINEKPGATELKHDYLWRFVRNLPKRGQIGIFNRSYYEEVLSTRIHPERLEDQQLPPRIRDAKGIWRQRFQQINNFEQYLTENGIHVMKFFLHLSKEKQRERLLERLEVPEKKWKFSMNDVTERALWDEYMSAFEDAITQTNTQRAPWYVVPADERWFSALVVADLVLDKLKSLKLRYPHVSSEGKKEMEKARKLLARDEA